MRLTSIKPGESRGEKHSGRNFSIPLSVPRNWSSRLNFCLQLGFSLREFRLNIYSDSIEPGGANRGLTRLSSAAIKAAARSRNSPQSTQALSNQRHDGCPVSAGLQFFADVRLGRRLPKSQVMSLARGGRSQSNRRIPTDPTQTLDAQASRFWSATHPGLATTDSS